MYLTRRGASPAGARQAGEYVPPPRGPAAELGAAAWLLVFLYGLCTFMLDEVWPHLAHPVLLKIEKIALFLETITHELNIDHRNDPENSNTERDVGL